MAVMDRIFGWMVSRSRRPAEAPRPADAEDARLARLASEIMPTPDELRRLRAKLPPPTVDYDDEGEQPF